MIPSRILTRSAERGMGSSSRIILPPNFSAPLNCPWRFIRIKTFWEKLMLRGMAADFSWEQSARAYVKVYEKLLPEKENFGGIER